MTNSPVPAGRRIFVALAALALLVLLLKPACETRVARGGAPVTGAAAHVAGIAAGHDGAPVPQCCADASDAQPVAPLLVMPGGVGAADGVATVGLALLITGIAAAARQQRWLRAPPRQPQSFYLRSARILR